VSIAMSSLRDLIYLGPFSDNDTIRPTVVRTHRPNLSQPLKQGAHTENVQGERSPLCAKVQALSWNYLGRCHVPNKIHDSGQNYARNCNFSVWSIRLYHLGISLALFILLVIHKDSPHYFC